MNFGFYKLYNTIETSEFFKYALLLCIVLVAVSKLGDINTNTIIGLIAGIVVILFLIDKTNVEDEDKEVELEEKKKNISNKSFEYLDSNPDLIKILDEMEMFRTFNKLIFEECLVHINNVIKIYEFVVAGTERYKYFYDLAKEEIDKSMNCLSSLILSMPVDYYEQDSYKNNVNIKTYSNLLKKYSMDIHKILKSYLYKIKQIGEDRWNNEPVTIYSNPMDYDDANSPFPNDMESKGYSEHYSLY